MVEMTCKCFLAWNSENSREGNGGEKKVFIELMKKGKEDKMQSKYFKKHVSSEVLHRDMFPPGEHEKPH